MNQVLNKLDILDLNSMCMDALDCQILRANRSNLSRVVSFWINMEKKNMIIRMILPILIYFLRKRINAIPREDVIKKNLKTWFQTIEPSTTYYHGERHFGSDYFDESLTVFGDRIEIVAMLGIRKMNVVTRYNFYSSSNFPV